MQLGGSTEKNRNFQLAMNGDAVHFKTKFDWLMLYRRFIDIRLNERNLANEPTVVNGAEALKHIRPWVVFGLDPKTASAYDIGSIFRRLIQRKPL